MPRLTQLAFIFFFSFIGFKSFAGTDSVRSDAYLGIHVNELVRQLLPNGSSSVNNNFNYLVTYIKYKPGYKKGTRMSGNFIFNSLTDNINGTVRFTNNNIFQYKIGKEKMYRFDEHFSFCYGWDILTSLNNSLTRSTSNSGGITLITNTQNNVLSIGTGPGLRFMYNIKPRILLGTDAGLYGSAIFSSISVKERAQDQPFQRTFEDNKLNYSLGITPPISLYFILKIR